MGDSAKFKRFVTALNALCAEHKVVMRASGSDIVIIDSDARDAELVRAEIFDATKGDSAHG